MYVFPSLSSVCWRKAKIALGKCYSINENDILFSMMCMFVLFLLSFMVFISNIIGRVNAFSFNTCYREPFKPYTVVLVLMTGLVNQWVPSLALICLSLKNGKASMRYPLNCKFHFVEIVRRFERIPDHSIELKSPIETDSSASWV